MSGRQSFHIVVAEPFDAQAVARLEAFGRVTVLDNSAPDTMVAALTDADALLVRARAHVTARIIDAAPKLKVIGRASSTVDHIDLRAAGRRNIQVVYAPRVAVASIAEFTVGLIIALHRRILSLDRELREGKFDTLRTPSGHELSHVTLGLLGLDPVAEHLGRIVSTAFGSRILYHDPADNVPTEFSGTPLGMDELISQCDLLSLHLALSPATRGIINLDRLAQMKASAMLINTSRGALVDCMDLAQALRRRIIAGAALDVFDTEPLPGDHPLRRCPNCILTPHVGGATLDASAERFAVTEDVLRVLKGEPPRFPFELTT